MEQKQYLFKGRDKRKKGWFWMDNEYLNGYGRIFGAIGTAIYVSLCRHADNETQQCFPAQKTIAKELKITDRTVRKYLRLFEKYHIISITKEKDTITKRWRNNVYTLLDKKEWLKPEEIFSSGKPEENNNIKEPKARGTRRPNKETHLYINKTHIADKSADSLMDLKEFINWCDMSPHRHIQIIGAWADLRKPNFNRKSQWKEFINRNVRVAKKISVFTDEQIQQAYDKLENDIVHMDSTGKKVGFITKYTLETLLKYIVV